MGSLSFVASFTLIHAAAYTLAGAIALRVSPDMYREKGRVLDYLRDMSNETESAHVTKWFFPAQILRGVLLAIVLLPIVGLLGQISFAARFAFFAGLLIFYADFASAVPFNGNIEGFVYMKPRYLQSGKVWKFYLETVLYAVIVGAAAAGLLF